MDQDKKAMGPIVLGKTDGSENSTFLPFSNIQGDEKPVLATEKYVKDSVEAAISDYVPPDQGGVTAKFVTEEIEKAVNSFPQSPDLSPYAKTEEVKSTTSGLATKVYVDGQISTLKKYCDEQFASIKKSLISIGIKL